MTTKGQKSFSAFKGPMTGGIVSYPRKGGFYTISKGGFLAEIGSHWSKNYGQRFVAVIDTFSTTHAIDMEVTERLRRSGKRGWLEALIDGKYVMKWRTETKESLKRSRGAWSNVWEFNPGSEEYKRLKSIAKPLVPNPVPGWFYVNVGD